MLKQTLMILFLITLCITKVKNEISCLLENEGQNIVIQVI